MADRVINPWGEDFARVLDVFFNGRPASEPERPKVTIEQLVRRGESCVRVNGRLYRVKVTELEPIG